MNTESDESFSDQPNGVENGGVAAVDRAFSILTAFQVEQESLALAELARRTGLYKSTIMRLITSLERAGFVRRLSDGNVVSPPSLSKSSIRAR